MECNRTMTYSGGRQNRLRAIIVVVVLLIALPVSAQRVVFPFTLDEEGWQDSLTDRVHWDGSRGVPPGSLRVTSAIAISPCMNSEAVGRWYVSAMAYNANIDGCVITAVGYDNAICTTGTTGSPQVLGETTGFNEWEEISFDFPLSVFGPYTQIQMYPLIDTCYFDNVDIRGPVSVTAVPTQSTYGLATLATVLAGAGLFLMRRLW